VPRARQFALSVDEFVEHIVLPEYRDVVSELRSLMRRHAPGAEELTAYGIPCYRRKRYLAVISPNKQGITFLFTRGAQFEDSYWLLRGAGKSSRTMARGGAPAPEARQVSRAFFSS